MDEITKGTGLSTDALEPLPAFTPAGLIDPCVDHDPFPGASGSLADAHAASKFAREAIQARGTPYGLLEFKNVYLAINTGVILDPTNGRCWYGDALGWRPRVLEAQLQAQLNAEPIAPGLMHVDASVFVGCPHREKLCVVSGPGYGAYGHWLLDVLPRLLAFKELGLAGSELYAPSIGAWGVTLAAAVGVDIGQRYVAPPGHVVHVDTLLVPTLIRVQTVIDRSSAESTWEVLANGLARQSEHRGYDGIGNRIYVSRARWSRGRTLTNNSEVEDWMARHGYTIIDPHALSLPEQVATFANAGEVVGEDGSGLHNVVFSRPGTRLTVVAMGRINTFHVGIANVKRQGLRYVEAIEHGDGKGWYFPMDRLQSLFG